MTPEQAIDLAARTLVAITDLDFNYLSRNRIEADRRRVASDIVGLLAHQGDGGDCVDESAAHCRDARRYSDGLRRTADLYGVK